ncbi:MAG TPA: hypothetical protein VFT90_03530 [Chryseosolibacter sp.]|nr:hypothetical protein [Chryseosolibacter sp.]
MRSTLLVVFLLLAAAASAQKASIKKVELAGDKIIVHYDLEDSNPGHEYQVSLYASQSNFTTALTKVKGDVGNEIKPGADKKIEWNIIEELGPFKGKLSLEIRGRVFIPVAKINSISEGDKFKRGKNHVVTWKPGNNNTVNIELLKDGQLVSSQLSQPNNGTHSLFIPTNAVVGKGYSLRITDTRDPENNVTSQRFAITRKVPLLLKVVPILAVGGVAAVVLGGGGEEGEGGSNGPDNDGTIPLPEFP